MVTVVKILSLLFTVVQKVWRTVEGVWAGWVAPLGGAERQTCPDWLRHLTHDIQLLLPWAPSDANAADDMVAMFTASVDYIHELQPGKSHSMVLRQSLALWSMV